MEVQVVDNWVKAVAATLGAFGSYLFGGWSALLGVLLTLAVLDYISGVVAAALEGRLSSAVGARGIAKKTGMFGIVAVGHLIDTTLGDGHLIRDAVMFWYLANEVLSVTENAGRIGVPIPPMITKAVAMLRSKGEGRAQP